MRSIRALGLLFSPLLLCGSSLASIHPDIGPAAEGGGGGGPAPAAPESPPPAPESPPTVKLPGADPAAASAPATPSTGAPAREPDPDEDLVPEPVRLHLSIYSTDGEGHRIDFLPEVCFSANEAAVRGFNRFFEDLGRAVILGGKKLWDQRTPAPFAPIPFAAGLYPPPPPPSPEQLRKAAEEAAERMHNHEVAQRLTTEAARLRSEGILEDNAEKQKRADQLVQRVAELLAKGQRLDGVACIPGCR